MTYFMGIDIGSRTCKAVVLDTSSALIADDIAPSGMNYASTAKLIRDRLIDRLGLTLAGIQSTVATGHELRLDWAQAYVPDIQCCARGVHAVCPTARTVIDIEAQTSQVIRLSESGTIISFVVSEKCAAGSGRFLDVVANVLRLSLQDVGPLSLKATKPVTFSAGCAVFGESEAISRVAEGTSKEDILAGVHRSIADRIAALGARAGLEQPCALVGGGALNSGLVKAIETRLHIESLLLPSRPELVGAIGAATIAREKAIQTREIS